MEWIDICGTLSIYDGYGGGFEGVGAAFKDEERASAAVQLGGTASAGMVGMVPDGLVCAKMTDEQVEVLRKQISVYTTICERLVGMLRPMSAQAQQDTAAGMSAGNVYGDSLVTSGYKTPGKHRWNPTLVQRKILESVFNEEHGSPSKEKISELTSQLSQHGQVSETNVCHWFSNRRARLKRKKAEGEAESGQPHKKRNQLVL